MNNKPDIVYARRCDRCGDRREWGNNLLCDRCAAIVEEQYELALKNVVDEKEGASNDK